MQLPASKPWYRQPLVWMLIAFPLSAVIGGITTFVLAVESDDGLVKDDYYAQGKQINRVLARDHAAAALGLHGHVNFDLVSNTVTVQLSSRTSAELPEHIRMELLHATRAGFDRSIDLQRTANNSYFALVPALAEGHWIIQLSTDTWRVNADMRLPGSGEIALDSQG